MSDLKTQIRCYVEAINPPFESETLMRERRDATRPIVAPRPRLTPAVVFLAAFVVVLGFGAVLALLPADQPTEPAGPAESPAPTSVQSVEPTTAPQLSSSVAPTTIPEFPSPADAEASVQALHDAWNAGDADTVRSLLHPVVYSQNQRPTIDIAVVGFEMKLNADCDPATPTLEVTCRVSLREDSFYTPGNVTWTRQVNYQVGTKGINFESSPPFWANQPLGDAYQYLRAFDDWLYERTLQGEPAPSGWIWVDPNNGLLPNALGSPCCAYSVAAVQAAPGIVDLVEEFLEESIEYPQGVTEVVDLPGGTLVRKIYGDQSTSMVFRGDELVLSLTHSCGECFGMDKMMTREPNGVLTAEGWQGGVWSVEGHQQTEINRLWPPDSPLSMDVLWLTDYTGMTADTLTGFTPEPGETFTLYDELVLEPRGNNRGLFGLHADCQTEGDQIAAALYSFEGDTPVPLIGWVVDYTTMTFVEVDDPESLTLGLCLRAEPRPAG